MDEKAIHKKLSRACAQLMIKHPFFGSLVYQHEMEITESVDTAASADNRMLFNPRFVEKVDPDQLVFLVAHEVMHIVFAHAQRRGNRDHELFNIACDAVINEILISERVGTFIEGGVRMQGAEKETSENIYKVLAQNSSPGEGNESGGNRKRGEGKGYEGHLSIKDLPEEVAQKTDAEVKAAIAEGKLKLGQAAAMARMQGKMSGALAGIIDKLLESKLPWYQILERYMVGKADQRYNWSRPHRRRLNIAYMPSRERYPSMGEIVVGIDVSGSISDREVSQFLGHCKAIFDLCHPKKIYVVYCTTEIEAVDEFDSSEEVVPRKNRWCGGTHMPAIMDWIKDKGIDPDVCVTFTDGETPFPNDNQVPCDLVWVFSTSIKPYSDPHGEVIYAVEEDC